MDIPFTLVFECVRKRSRRLQSKRVPYFTSTKLSTHRNVWRSYPWNISSPTRVTNIHEITVWVCFPLFVSQFSILLLFSTIKGTEKSDLDLTVSATWCRLMCEGCGEGFVCVCGAGLCFGVERGKGICVFVRSSSWRSLTTERCKWWIYRWGRESEREREEEETTGTSCILKDTCRKHVRVLPAFQRHMLLW